MATALSVIVDLHLHLQIKPSNQLIFYFVQSNANISFGCILTFTEAEYLTYVH